MQESRLDRRLDVNCKEFIDSFGQETREQIPVVSTHPEPFLRQWISQSQTEKRRQPIKAHAPSILYKQSILYCC